MRLADPPYVSDIPNVDAVIVVDAGQLVVPFIERQRDRIRIPRVRRMLGHVTENEMEGGGYFVSVCYIIRESRANIIKSRAIGDSLCHR